MRSTDIQNVPEVTEFISTAIAGGWTLRPLESAGIVYRWNEWAVVLGSGRVRLVVWAEYVAPVDAYNGANDGFDGYIVRFSRVELGRGETMKEHRDRAELAAASFYETHWYRAGGYNHTVERAWYTSDLNEAREAAARHDSRRVNHCRPYPREISVSDELLKWVHGLKGFKRVSKQNLLVTRETISGISVDCERVERKVWVFSKRGGGRAVQISYGGKYPSQRAVI